MFPRRPQEGTTSSIPFSSPSPILVLLLLLTSPPPSLAESPPLLSLLVPWAAEGAPGAAGVGGALETLGEAPYLSTPGDERRLQAFLESDRMQGLTGGPATPEDWESPKNPDLFLLTEVGGGSEEGRRRRTANDQEEVPHGSEAHRMKRNGGFVSGGSRIRTGGNGGGYVGSSGMRVGSGFGSFGPGRMGGGQVGGRMNEGPSLSIVNPLDVLRQRLLLEIARRRMRESEDQIQANRELLKSIGKREVGVGREEDASRGGGPGKDKAHAQTPSSM